MSEEQRITTERRGHLLLIGLNRPAKRNAFDREMLEEMGQAYGELNRDPELRCGVLFAHGDHFTAGLDLAKVAPSIGSGDLLKLEGGMLDPFRLKGPDLTKPVVAAVQGICFTAGIELMLACDIRIAAANTRFGQIEVKRGLFPFGGATIRMVREAGWGNAMRYLLTADEFNAEEAYRIGFVQEVVETGRQLERALEIAGVVAAQAPLGVYSTLASARKAILEGERAAAADFQNLLGPVLASEDIKEGVQSFLERRAGNYKGK